MESSRDTERAAAALSVAGRAAAAACGVLTVSLGAFVIWRSAALIALLYVAAMLAVVLDRPVAALVRRGFARAWALALVLIGGAAVVLVAVAVACGPLVSQARGLATAAPTLADRVRAALVGRFGGALEGTPVPASLHDALSRGAGAVASGIYGAAGGVVSAAGALVTVLALAVLLLVNGPTLVERAIRALPARRRSWGERLLSIGALAWATRGPGVAVAALLSVAAYDLVENYALSPIVFRRTVGLSALGQFVAVLFLGYHFGVIGAVLAIPAVATVQILILASRSPASVPTSPVRRASAAQDPGSTAKTWSTPGDRSR